MSTANQFDTDVAIIGYGPTGVSAAVCLGQYGLRAIAFEREKDIYPRARAVTVNDWTMRCFQSVGLDQELARGMDRTAALRWVTYDGQELMRMEFPPSSLGEHPRSYAIYQPVMEQTLRRGVERHKDTISVRYGAEVIGIEQDEHGVTVRSLDLQTGEESSIRARYALACDGGSSPTRERLGIKLIGETVETRWVVIDARVKRWWPDRHILTFWSDKKRPVVDIALALGNHRWEFPLEDDESESDFATKEQQWKLLNSLGVTENEVEIHQHAFYRHHVRHAERWRADRVFLLGDAAHLMPPWAGAGMQSGIRDAFNLCWKLREVLNGRLPDSVLDSYETERAPNVALMTGIAVQMGRIIKQQLSEGEIAALAPPSDGPPPEPPILLPPVLEAGWLRGPAGCDSIVGKMAPQPRIADACGKLCQLDELLGQGFVLLGDGLNPASLLSPQEKAEWDALGARYVAVYEPKQRGRSSSDIIDLQGTLLAWLRSHNVRAVALRPDRFVAASDQGGLAVPACTQ
ncbi:bifunctional 3-(3-hydroxy-phenyl)propionate/3-hydroxycinnamic acid hydroxylase [Cupriavidus sp. CV2]|uniref:bifunctional 3-(3-hydroxy-phenyl)propionate/3-hydroxycinnamic acid hydroxylase n=1 Tax=Cupriavidus ulmosensis TaxID=3065913 RepID=UPI00296B06E5|nr:bifunctional 3-(3-hydroxy-phenyl)propionate/3-hydroxycinnamic acid hydroxylase [Cupriavidus sp. CV2]MDW3688240.1 bifunctional 3-(3-hydroxy-phenyl)propionate/3-hydroxycinnamic acid hydroxylase [Cupriavidus sp. CV2]